MNSIIEFTEEDVLERKLAKIKEDEEWRNRRIERMKEEEIQKNNSNINRDVKYKEVYLACKKELLDDKDVIKNKFRNGYSDYYISSKSKCSNYFFREATVDAFNSVFGKSLQYVKFTPGNYYGASSRIDFDFKFKD